MSDNKESKDLHQPATRIDFPRGNIFTVCALFELQMDMKTKQRMRAEGRYDDFDNIRNKRLDPSVPVVYARLVQRPT